MRLSQVHGDFHPFNILFQADQDFRVLDRSRGAWGEPADDVSCLAINFIFFSMQKYGRFEAEFRELYDAFWESYSAVQVDAEMNRVIQPWYAWRGLVVANPVWYPNLHIKVRRKLLRFVGRVLQEPEFDIQRVNEYLGAD
jgi:hypothetical protein